MNITYIAITLVKTLAYSLLFFGAITANMAYAVGFFVGVNRIDWTPEQTPNKGKDKWFTFWARLGIKRGKRHNDHIG